MHLILDARMMRSGGIGTYIKELILAFYEEVQLTLLIYAEDIQAVASFPKIKTILMKSPIYSLHEQIELIRKIPPSDFFFTPHFNIPLLPIRAKKRICTIQDFYHLARPLPFLQKLYAKLFYNAAALLSDHLITPSSFSTREMKRLLTFSCKGHVEIPHPLPSWIEDYKDEVAQHKTIPGDYILAVGNVKPHKNLPRLIEAFHQLDRSEFLVIVGRREGFITEERGFSARLSERVIFTDYINEGQLAGLYQHAKLFVFPSLYEGFGFPPLEAMAFGAVVIASKEASIAEVCKEGAYYVDARLPVSIAAGMRLCLENEELRKKLIEKGEKVAYSYTREKFKKRYLALINESSSCT